MYKQVYLFFLGIIILISSCNQKSEKAKDTIQPVYHDIAYMQDYAIKYALEEEDNLKFKKVYTDRNDVIQVLTSAGLYRPINGHFQYPGLLKPDKSYIPMADKHVSDMGLFENQFIYLDNKAVFSNAWAGKLFSKHTKPAAKIICAGKDFTFLISDGTSISLLNDSKIMDQQQLSNEKILDIKFNTLANQFMVLTGASLYAYFSESHSLLKIFDGSGFTAFEILKNNEIIIGTHDGFYTIDALGKLLVDKNNKLPWTEITSIKEINDQLWFGSTKGAFMLKDDGKFNYYYGQRWIPGDVVVHIAKGPENSVLILTDKGLGQICFEEMTLEAKALRYEKQVRHRQIRYGINSNVTRLMNHDLSTAENRVADSDNLWTGMYLGSQLFRYLATHSEEARQNCYEAFEAMERMHEINGIPGLFGRSFERRGYQEFRKEYRSYVENYWYEGYNGTVSWRHAEDSEWDWRASASSDQTVGQIFALTLIAEYIDDEEWKQRAINLLDGLMTYIVENDMCLVDYNGLPTLWGRWHPAYVNRFDTMVGDRRICSSNIIAFLQTAYRFTGKEMYKEKAFELMHDHGYLENLATPISEIGQAPDDADEWSKMLSSEWNHSDDEMYFLAYWGLYPYAFNDSLKDIYKDAIKDHWNLERPEKNSLWNFCFAMTGESDFDLDESIWHLKEFPLDMIQYETRNSHRKDIEFMEPGFWGQTTTEVLPPDERPELKHNRNLFKLDAGDRQSELSAGDTYLLPYWMGRFLGVISAPQ